MSLPPSCTRSVLLVALLSCHVQAGWRVALRPLEEAPYGRIVKPLFAMHSDTNLSWLEGAGVTVKTTTDLFDVTMPKSSRERKLQFQLAYLTAKTEFDHNAVCAVAITIHSTRSDTLQLKIPLRSLDSSVEPFEKLKVFDYLAPEFSVPLPADSERLRATASIPQNCGAGTLVFLDPKVWSHEDDHPAKRFLFIVSDSISSDWFDGGRHFMPALQQFFSPPLGALATNVYSVATNTNDATNILARMKFEVRDSKRIRDQIPNLNTGLVPAFLNAGYDVLTYNSNLLLSTAWKDSGFRNLYTLNTNETFANQRHPEVLTAMILDWIQRHPDHDAMFLTWFNSTHYGVLSPRHRANLDLSRMPYHSPRRVLHYIEMQARGISYVDLVLEDFFKSRLIQESDVLFFPDHGVNFDTLEHPTPIWGFCGTATRVANWHSYPVEVRIPVGIRVKDYTPPPIGHETSLIDWIKTAVKHHNARIDVSAWEGRELERTSSSDVILMASHGLHGAARTHGRHFFFSDVSCSPHSATAFFNLDQSPASAADVNQIVNELHSRSLLSYQRLDLDIFHGTEDCSLRLQFPFGYLSSMMPEAPNLVPDPSRWFSKIELYVPEVYGEAGETAVQITGSPAGCGRVQVGSLRYSLGESFVLSGSGLESLLAIPRQDVGMTRDPSVRLQWLPNRFLRRGNEFIQLDSEFRIVEKTQFSAELKMAMRRWGYIQGEDENR